MAAPSNIPERLARIETELSMRGETVSKTYADLEEVRRNYIKREDLTTTQDTILAALEALRQEMTKALSSYAEENGELVARVDALEKAQAEQRGQQSVISWVAKGALGAAIVSCVGWVWKHITGGA